MFCVIEYHSFYSEVLNQFFMCYSDVIRASGFNDLAAGGA
jgi:hypothetical protein